MLGSCFVFSCVVADVWMMEQEELKMKIRNEAVEKLSTKVFSLRKVLCCGWQHVKMFLEFIVVLMMGGMPTF
jgi:hypothetical protein